MSLWGFRKANDDNPFLSHSQLLAVCNGALCLAKKGYHVKCRCRNKSSIHLKMKGAEINRIVAGILKKEGVEFVTGMEKHSKKNPVAWYCRLSNEYPPFLQEHYWYYLASDCMLQLYQVLFLCRKKGNPALFRLKKLRVYSILRTYSTVPVL